MTPLERDIANLQAAAREICDGRPVDTVDKVSAAKLMRVFRLMWADPEVMGHIQWLMEQCWEHPLRGD